MSVFPLIMQEKKKPIRLSSVYELAYVVQWIKISHCFRILMATKKERSEVGAGRSILLYNRSTTINEFLSLIKMSSNTTAQINNITENKSLEFGGD